MGTNFYHRYNECSCCGRYDERHIGKASVGWQFSFKAYNNDEGVPFIASWEDWQSELRTGRIFDEYGQEWARDDFIAKIEKTKGGKNHYDYLRDSPEYGRSYLAEMWKDSEDWDFSLGGFS